MKRTALFALIACILLGFLSTGCIYATEMRYYDNYRENRIPSVVYVGPPELALQEMKFEKGVFGRSKAKSINPLEFRDNLLHSLEQTRIFLSSRPSEQDKERYSPYELTVRFRRAGVRFAGFTNRGWAISLWFFAWLPSWFVNDEIYRVDLEAEMEITNVETRKTVYRKPFKVTYSQPLDDYQRGWQLYGIYRVPESLGEANWDAVEEEIMQYATNRLIYDMVENLCTEFYSAWKNKKILETSAR